MNLAPFRFARVLFRQGGPIERIEYGRIEAAGESLFQANAYLARHLHLERSTNQIFGTADGSGTHRSALIARYKAISEAMERWALYYLSQAELGHEFGMDRDPTSTGMAAFPGLFKAQARRRARREAVERFCLVGWWDRQLRSRKLPVTDRVEGIELQNPLSRDRVVVTWEESAEGLVAYGFSASRTLSRAVWKARIEMERMASVLHRYLMANPGFELSDLPTLENRMERRAMYFAMPEGHQEFQSRVQSSSSNPLTERLLPLVDREVVGPWSRYATVWRILYPMPTQAYLRDRDLFFYW